MKIRHTLDEVVDFIMKHRRGKAFRNYTHSGVRINISWAAANNSLVCVYDDLDDTLIGVGVGFREAGILHVENILTIRKGVLKTMMRWFHSMYPNHRITARRHDKFVTYDTPRLKEKIEKLT